MKKMIFLLVSAVVLLLSSAVPSPTPHKPKGHPNLNSIVDLVTKYNTSLVEFVDDVSLLVDAGCENKFFCKVHDILHGRFGKRKMEEDEKEIVNNLKKFIDGTKANCAVLLKDETSANSCKTIPQLLNYLVKCIRKRNLGALKSSA